jgi:hypothetical protein
LSKTEYGSITITINTKFQWERWLEVVYRASKTIDGEVNISRNTGEVAVVLPNGKYTHKNHPGSHHRPPRLKNYILDLAREKFPNSLHPDDVDPTKIGLKWSSVPGAFFELVRENKLIRTGPKGYTIPDKPKSPSKDVRPWSEEDKENLRRYSEQETPVSEISMFMNRTPGAIRQKALSMGLPIGSRRPKPKPQPGAMK